MEVIYQEKCQTFAGNIFINDKSCNFFFVSYHYKFKFLVASQSKDEDLITLGFGKL